ncbi:50S ribosomal protein L29 [Candidatus Woesearchaeota archaeon]|nr:50S ribosomal protein L29 [Candidatus Woesearchaeota archaeon]
MKFKELKVMNEADLGNTIIELKKELMKTNSQIAVGTVPKNPGKVRQAKKAIAKILTITQQRGGTKKE